MWATRSPAWWVRSRARWWWPSPPRLTCSSWPWPRPKARPGRSKIVTDDLNFPSDLYIFQGIVERPGGGHRLEIVSSPDGIHGPVEGLAVAIDDDTADSVSLSHTAFKSAYTYDMAAVTALAHRAGACADAVGSEPLGRRCAG